MDLFFNVFHQFTGSFEPPSNLKKHLNEVNHRTRQLVREAGGPLFGRHKRVHESMLHLSEYLEATGPFGAYALAGMTRELQEERIRVVSSAVIRLGFKINRAGQLDPKSLLMRLEHPANFATKYADICSAGQEHPLAFSTHPDIQRAQSLRQGIQCAQDAKNAIFGVAAEAPEQMRSLCRLKGGWHCQQLAAALNVLAAQIRLFEKVDE